MAKEQPDGEESAVEEAPAGRRKTTQKVAREVSEGLSRPDKPRRQTTGRVPTAGVGLRSATQKVPSSERVSERKKTAKVAVKERKDTHRKAIWDKLDAARQQAEERKQRLQTFAPQREVIEDDDDDFDF